MKRSDSDERRFRSQHKSARAEMAAFDQLPQEIRTWIRSANLNWECTKLKTRLNKAKTSRGSWWGVERLLEQYRAEDAA